MFSILSSSIHSGKLIINGDNITYCFIKLNFESGNFKLSKNANQIFIPFKNKIHLSKIGQTIIFCLVMYDASGKYILINYRYLNEIFN